ncbi:hypothetical protein [Sellimonas intestinalis]|nr:hypothetical protein [Sellimonas intestinalis]
MAEFYGYKASIANSEDAGERWKPSIHMPKEAARLWLKVTDARVERLQDITNKDVEKEGVEKKCIDSYIRQMPCETEEYIRLAYIIAFQDIWDSIIKKKDLLLYGWNANPWVWVRQSGKKLIRGTEGQVNRMSDDLISRKAVIAAVDRHTREDGTLDDDISVILEEVKTAFDKEKVVKQIEDYRDLVPEWALKEIIEIVKKKEG